MREKKGLYNIIDKELPGLSRLVPVLGISLLVIQFLAVPAFGQKVEYHEGYNLIFNDDGSKDIINGDFNFLRWDGVWRPNEELNISNGSWPYLYTKNGMNADFKVDDTTLSLPKNNTKFKLKQNSISYDITFPKSELQGKETSINLTDAFIDFPYSLKSKKPKNKYEDKHNIKYGRFEFKAGVEHIAVHDDTPTPYIEGGKIYQDVTYLFPNDYEFKIENGQIRLIFKKDALNKLTGNVIIEIRTWDVVEPYNWGGNVTFNQATDVKSTGNVELKQRVSDYALYTRFDEGNGITIHNENPSSIPLGYLSGVDANTYESGKYGQAIHFNGSNRVTFNDDPSIRLGGDFTISFYIKLAPGVNNVDTDITRKGSTRTVEPDPLSWWKVEIKDNVMQGVVTKNGQPSPEEPYIDTQDRRDDLWHFVAFTRQSTTCSLMVDGTIVASRTNDCYTDTWNTAQLAIGAKDTADSGTGPDYTHGTIDEVRFFNRKLSASNLTSIKNNEHYTTGTVTRNLTSVILPGEELKELGCNGTWDRSITKVDILASANNTTWDIIQSNATNNTLYSVGPDNNYKYTRCSLSTTNTSRTPIIETIRARIDSKTLFYINGTVMDNVSKSGIEGVKVSTNNSLSTKTNGIGFYSLEVNSGAYNLTVTFEPTYYPNSTIVTISDATKVKDINLSKKPTGNITGSVNS